MSKEQLTKESSKELTKELTKELPKTPSALRTYIETESAKVFYKDVAMICDDYLPEWKKSLEDNVVRFGAPFIHLFVFSMKDSVYIIKQKSENKGEGDAKSYDISEKFNNDRTRKICREYKAYTFFTSKNFSKYIKEVFDTCAHKILNIDANTFVVQLDLMAQLY